MICAVQCICRLQSKVWVSEQRRAAVPERRSTIRFSGEPACLECRVAADGPGHSPSGLLNSPPSPLGQDTGKGNRIPIVQHFLDLPPAATSPAHVARHPQPSSVPAAVPRGPDDTLGHHQVWGVQRVERWIMFTTYNRFFANRKVCVKTRVES